MAAYGTDPARYLPPHTSQLATKLSADGVDDCLVCQHPRPRQRRQPRRGHPHTGGPRTLDARRSSGPPSGCARRSTTRPRPPTSNRRGPLPPSAAGRMVALLWPAYPTLRTDDIDFKTLVALLLDKHIAVLAGNPSHIEGPSPLKRVGDVGHAIALLRARQRKDGLEILVDDPYRPGGKHLRGEWVAAEADPAVRLPRLGLHTHRGLGRAVRRLDSGEPRPPPARRAHRPHRGGGCHRGQAGRADRATPACPHRTARGGQPGRLRVRPSPRRSMPSGSPSATSSRHGGQREPARGPPRLAPGRAAGTRARPSRYGSARSRS